MKKTKQFRYIVDPKATRRSAVNKFQLLANNQIPDDTKVCFRIVLRKNTDIKHMKGYSITHDTRRLEELNIILRVRINNEWKTMPLNPDDMRSLAEIAQSI